MCGIAGIFHYREQERSVDLALLEAMTTTLAHRGPDGAGTWTGPGVGLGHRRLSIIDLSERGRQPMRDDRGDLVLTYNGEVYNFRELRSELQARGHRFASDSDSEVILCGYREWGAAVVERLSGIFAFAIWDASRRALFLARDPLGVKPLFFSDLAGTFRFGSEPKAILRDPAVPRDVDHAALDGFFTFSYTPAPATGFAAVRQLLPGECATVDTHGVRRSRYYRIPYADRARVISFDAAKRELSDLLLEVTRAQLVADVPVGAFLSGGIDSAAIVHAMQQASPGRVNTLTVGFGETGFDERVAAERTAQALGVPFHSQLATLDAADLLPKLSQHMEEPTADSSMVPVYLLCREARKRFTVAMSGDGADEILAGYDTYRATHYAALYRRLPALLRRGVISRLAHALPVSDGKYSLHQRATRFVEGAELGAGRDHAAWRVIFGAELKQRLYAPEFLRRVAGADALGLYAAAIDEVPTKREELLGLLHADTAFYLPNDMLVKVDRMSMANGLEVRVPFLDTQMVRFAADLPPDHKLHRGRIRKHVLRESLRGTVPDSVLDLPKSGFNIPVEAWMRGTLHDLLLDLARTHATELGEFLRTDELERVTEEHRTRRADHGHALFSVLLFCFWLENRRHAWK